MDVLGQVNHLNYGPKEATSRDEGVLTMRAAGDTASGANGR